MLTPFESNILPSLLARSFATRALDVVKMRTFVPCDVEDKLTGYKARIVEVVYDPLSVPETNARFIAAGYHVRDNMQVIAVTDTGSILLWGGLNSVFHLRPHEKIKGFFDDAHLAFNDILDLTNRFKIKNKKPEIDALIDALKTKYPRTP